VAWNFSIGEEVLCGKYHMICSINRTKTSDERRRKRIWCRALVYYMEVSPQAYSRCDPLHSLRSLVSHCICSSSCFTANEGVLGSRPIYLAVPVGLIIILWLLPLFARLMTWWRLPGK
jgi:hypothetical protein